MDAVAAGSRIGWQDLPVPVRAALEEIVGGPVVEALSQPGGFSPGTADRVRTADGRRAFVKAVSPDLNPHAPTLHRQEARVTAALPAAVGVPRLIGTYDDGHWVALVLDDVAGRHPATPWRRDELDAVLSTLARLATTLTPAPLTDVPEAPDVLAEDFAGWDRLAADPPGELDPWAAANLGLLRRLAAAGTAALHGVTLLHCDVRADNLLLGDDGEVTVVDWPWACRGPAWFDVLGLLVNVRLYGEADVDQLLRTHAPEADPGEVTAVLAGIAGFCTHAARLPAPPGLPTVRAFQRAQAVTTLAWVRERLAAGARP